MLCKNFCKNAQLRFHKSLVRRVLLSIFCIRSLDQGKCGRRLRVPLNAAAEVFFYSIALLLFGTTVETFLLRTFAINVREKRGGRKGIIFFLQCPCSHLLLDLER